MLRYVPLKCCDRLAGALRAWICLLAGALVERRQVTRRFALETRFFSPSIAVRFSCKVTQSVKSCNFVIFFLFILILNWMRVPELCLRVIELIGLDQLKKQIRVDTVSLGESSVEKTAAQMIQIFLVAHLRGIDSDFWSAFWVRLVNTDPGVKHLVNFTAPFNNMRTQTFKAQPTKMRFSLSSIKCSATPPSFRLLSNVR